MTHKPKLTQNTARAAHEELAEQMAILEDVAAHWEADQRHALPQIEKHAYPIRDKARELREPLYVQLNELYSRQTPRRLTIYRVRPLKLLRYELWTALTTWKLRAIQLWRIKWTVLGIAIILLSAALLLHFWPNIISQFESLLSVPAPIFAPTPTP